MKGGLVIAIVAASLLLISGLMAAPLVLVLMLLFFTVAINGIIGTTATSLAMQDQRARAGSASAIIGVTMSALGGISVPLAGQGGTSLMTMSLTYLRVLAAGRHCLYLVCQNPGSTSTG